MSERSGAGTLWLVATPIGNLEDLTLRALRLLREASLILAEDTRRTRQLLQAQGIEGRSLERLDDHVARERAPAIIAKLLEGAQVVLVSDAGTPLVSDPGALLVREALAAGVQVECAPGPSAVLVALSLSGLGGTGFRFVGFLPREGSERRAALLAIARDPLPTVLFEAPSRSADTLAELAAACGPERRGALARELTKLHEEVRRGTLQALAESAREGVLGEVTLVIEGLSETLREQAQERDETAVGDPVEAALDAALGAGMKPSEAAREVARVLGLSRSDVYKRALARGGKTKK